MCPVSSYLQSQTILVHVTEKPAVHMDEEATVQGEQEAACVGIASSSLAGKELTLRRLSFACEFRSMWIRGEILTGTITIF